MRLRLAGPASAALLLLLLVLAGAEALAQQRTPFGISPVESAPVPGGGAITAYILAKQAEFYRLMTRAVGALRTDPAALWTLLTLAFGYGVFHAAGPGHGKAVISAYIVANERALLRGVLIACLAALLQAAMAIAIVVLFVIILGTTGRSVSAAVHAVEIATFAALVGFGGWLAWRKARSMRLAFASGPAGAGEDCGHFHLPGPREALAMNWREAGGVIVAAGLRPCAGAVIILVFALSQGLFLAGGAAVLAMSAGTALTTSLIAALAVFMKMTALRLASGRGGFARIMSVVEFLAALAVLALGALLLWGYLSGQMPRGG
jgi:ABC-type nickel/cobalt efflux system permease component RcnA